MPPLSLSPADAAFVQAAFDDAMTLIEAARDHIAGGGVRAIDPEVSPRTRMRAAQELSRLTNRATAAMSLLLLVKALEAGQDVGVVDIAGQAEAILAEINRPATAPLDDELPPDLAALLVQGEALFAQMPRVRSLLEPAALGPA